MNLPILKAVLIILPINLLTPLKAISITDHKPLIFPNEPVKALDKSGKPSRKLLIVFTI